MPKNILIVEDDHENMRLIEMVLRVRSYILLLATDREEALETVVGDKPSLIIMDMQLPKVSGLEVTKRFKQMPAFKDVCIIAINEYAVKGDKEEFIEGGCDAYLSKTIDTRELPRVVAEMLSGQQRDST